MRTPGSDSGFGSETTSKPLLDDVDFAFLDYLVEKALETFFPAPIVALAMLDEDCWNRTSLARRA